MGSDSPKILRLSFLPSAVSLDLAGIAFYKF